MRVSHRACKVAKTLVLFLLQLLLLQQLIGGHWQRPWDTDKEDVLVHHFCAAALKPHWNGPFLLPFSFPFPHFHSPFPWISVSADPFIPFLSGRCLRVLTHRLPCRETFYCQVSFLMLAQHLVTVSWFYPLRNSLKNHNLVSYYISSNTCFLNFFLSSSHFCLSVSK